MCGSTSLPGIQLYFCLYIEGLLWPLQSLPKWLRTISYILPVAKSTDGAREILLKGNIVVSFISPQHILLSIHCQRIVDSVGWGLSHEPVLLGLVTPATWVLVFCILAGIGLHLKK